MAVFRITTNIARVLPTWRRWPQLLYDTVAGTSKQVGEAAVKAVGAAAPVREKQRLRTGFAYATRRPTPSRVELSVFVKDEVAAIYRYVALGTRPHEIVARRGRALRWKDANGSYVFRRRVTHPGTHPNPFAERALAKFDAGGYWKRAGEQFAEAVR